MNNLVGNSDATLPDVKMENNNEPNCTSTAVLHSVTCTDPSPSNFIVDVRADTDQWTSVGLDPQTALKVAAVLHGITMITKEVFLHILITPHKAASCDMSSNFSRLSDKMKNSQSKGEELKREEI